MNRRLKRLSISPCVLLRVLWTWRHEDYLVLPVMDGLPEGVEVLSIRYDDFGLQFVVLVSHPSFPEVPEGQLIPTEPLCLRSVEIHGRLIQDLAHYAARLRRDEPPPDGLAERCLEVARAGVAPAQNTGG